MLGELLFRRKYRGDKTVITAICEACAEFLKQKSRATHLTDAYRVVISHVESRKILVFDDLYRSGATVTSVAKTLIEKGRAKEVRGLALTKTRSNK